MLTSILTSKVRTKILIRYTVLFLHSIILDQGGGIALTGFGEYLLLYTFNNPEVVGVALAGIYWWVYAGHISNFGTRKNLYSKMICPIQNQ